MKVVLQHHRPVTINLMSGDTLRLDVIGESASISREDSESAELMEAVSRGHVRVTAKPLPADSKEPKAVSNHKSNSKRK